MIIEETIRPEYYGQNARHVRAETGGRRVESGDGDGVLGEKRSSPIATGWVVSKAL